MATNSPVPPYDTHSTDSGRIYADDDAMAERELARIRARKNSPAPERIWLQRGQAKDPDECTLSHVSTDGNGEVEYVRADLAATPAGEVVTCMEDVRRLELRRDALCEKASILDCINQELRENEAGFQATTDDDPRAAIRLLVDAVRTKERRQVAVSALQVAK